MILSLKLAYRNLIGAGLRTWLSVIVLSMSYVVIIWMQGFLEGWNQQARRDTIEQEIGGGQYWHAHYDPYDSLTLKESHAPAPAVLQSENTAPILIAQATIYPQGRMQSVVLKGIDPAQSVLALPTSALAKKGAYLPVLLGERAAKSANLRVGDQVTVRWRDAHGTYDAREAQVVHIMDTDVPTVDAGTFWVPLEDLRSMLQMPREATLLVVDETFNDPPSLTGWVFRDQTFLLEDFTSMMKMERVSSAIMYTILLALALLAIFDTQVLSIFRRRREIGTLIALGMTRGGVIRLFTIEGALHGVLAVGVAALYGVPLLIWQAHVGLSMPEVVDNYGMAIASTIYPAYSVRLVVGTVLLVMAAVTLISYLPTRRIARLNPTDAIRGKLS